MEKKKRKKYIEYCMPFFSFFFFPSCLQKQRILLNSEWHKQLFLTYWFFVYPEYSLLTCPEWRGPNKLHKWPLMALLNYPWLPLLLFAWPYYICFQAVCWCMCYCLSNKTAIGKMFSDVCSVNFSKCQAIIRLYLWLQKHKDILSYALSLCWINFT